MSLYRDRGVVLRTHKLGEADRIITLLTRQHGIVRAVGKGVRKTSSRFGARLEPTMHIDVQFAEGRSLDVITQIETIDSFASRLGSDYPQYTAATAMLETAERVVGPELGDTGSTVPQYQLLVSALRALTERRQPAGVLLDSYQLRALSIAGYAPSFGLCAGCGADGPHRHFHVAHGGMLCDACRVPGSSVPSPATVALLGALLAGDWPVVEVSDDRSRREASSAVSAYLSWHLERGLRSLSLVDRA